jgi:hypothetical protein
MFETYKDKVAMKHYRTAAVALALTLSAAAHAATDGTLGMTSTGTFNVSLTVLPSGGDTVQILGLDDVVLPTVIRVAGQDISPNVDNSEFFCINRSGSSAPVNITITQASGASPTGRFSLNGSGGAIMDSIGLEVLDPQGNQTGGNTFHGSTLTAPPSGPGCSVTSGSGVANILSIYTPFIPADSTVADGALSQIFTLLVSIP